MLNSGHDFSCVILTADAARRRGEPADPRHDRAGPDDRAVKAFHPELRRGDVIRMTRIRVPEQWWATI